MPSGDETLPLGDPPILERQTQSGLTELAQRLIAFPFTPPDVNLKQNDGLSTSNDWFTKHDKNKIDELGMLDFYASSGPQSVGVVPKLHNTSAGVEIYRLPPTLNRDTFERTEGPYRPGVTKKSSNKRSGKKIAKFKVGTMAQSGLASFYLSRLLGYVVAVPPATYRTMDIQEFEKIGDQARTTGHPECTQAWAELQKPEVTQWYQNDILFTAADFNTVKTNVDQAVNILTSRKDKGLFLDASLSLALGVDEETE